ncbi:MAG TPA: hypothetical protein VN812_10785 [Candidatus Acidoferrales bacterium]|nr:hypothetical protein [Candidatus Acidoferrales bacterium]
MELAIETVPIDRIPALIGDGTISNALTVVAFHLFDLVQRRPSG